MKINQITLTDLRRMNGKEGLILQGGGGETQEWVDGINKMLTDKGILLDNTKFENVSVFKSDGVTCNLLGIASHTLKQNGMADEAKEMCSRVTSSESYCEALNIIGEYVNITDGSEQSDDIDEDYGESEAMKL